MQKNLELKLILSAILAGLIITIGAAFVTEDYSDSIQGGIAEKVMRLHILANSNSDKDQALKEAVRNGILDEFKDWLSRAEEIGETREFLIENLDTIRQCALNTIKQQGYDYAVTASVSEDFFPTKKYGDIVLPAGSYEALRVEIGEATGNNWWCVVFPPLCYVDVTLNELPDNDKEELKSLLTDEEYEIISSEASGQITPKIKFKIVELWQQLRQGKPLP